MTTFFFYYLSVTQQFILLFLSFLYLPHCLSHTAIVGHQCHLVVFRPISNILIAMLSVTVVVPFVLSFSKVDASLFSILILQRSQKHPNSRSTLCITGQITQYWFCGEKELRCCGNVNYHGSNILTSRTNSVWLFIILSNRTFTKYQH